MMELAAKAYASGDYARAAELYLNAWRSDPDPSLLYATARSEHLGGEDNKALALYQQFVAAPGADAGRVKKAHEFMAAIAAKAFDARVAEADAAKKDDPKLAARLYLAAYKSAAARVDVLFKAATAEYDAGDLPAARALFRDYLGKAPADAVDRERAEARLEAIARKLPTEPVAAKTVADLNVPAKTQPAAPTVAANAVTTAQGDSRVLAWALAGTGAALALGGLGLYLATRGDLAQFDSDTAGDADGRIRTISEAEAAAQASSINLRMGTALALGAGGAAIAGIGAWLVVRAPARVTVLPVPGGAMLAMEF